MRILVLCTGNSCRSQMAAGVLRALDPRLEVISAGTEPAAGVNPVAVEVMAEIAIDISGARPTHVDRYRDESFDYVVTVCADADARCPRFTGVVHHRVHIGFPDPARATGSAEERRRVYRASRDAIRDRFSDWYRSTLRPAIDAAGAPTEPEAPRHASKGPDDASEGGRGSSGT